MLEPIKPDDKFSFSGGQLNRVKRVRKAERIEKAGPKTVSAPTKTSKVLKILIWTTIFFAVLWWLYVAVLSKIPDLLRP